MQSLLRCPESFKVTFVLLKMCNSLNPTFICLKESEIQLGSRDGGHDSRFLLLGIHRDSDSRRLYIIQTGCKQVTAQDSVWEQIHPEKPRVSSILNWKVAVLLSRMGVSLWFEGRSVTPQQIKRDLAGSPQACLLVLMSSRGNHHIQGFMFRGMATASAKGSCDTALWNDYNSNGGHAPLANKCTNS